MVLGGWESIHSEERSQHRLDPQDFYSSNLGSNLTYNKAVTVTEQRASPIFPWLATQAQGRQEEKLMMSPGLHQHASEDGSTVGSKEILSLFAALLCPFSLYSEPWVRACDPKFPTSLVSCPLFQFSVSFIPETWWKRRGCFRCKIKWRSLKVFIQNKS